MDILAHFVKRMRVPIQYKFLFVCFFRAHCVSSATLYAGDTMINKSRCGTCFQSVCSIMGMADLDHIIIQLWIHRVSYYLSNFVFENFNQNFFKKRDHANMYKITIVLSALKGSCNEQWIYNGYEFTKLQSSGKSSFRK